MKKTEITRFIADAEKRRPSRREFMRQAALLGLAAPTAAMLFGGSALAATPRQGGKFRFAAHGGSTDDSLDPGLTFDYFRQMMDSAIGNELTEINSDSQVIPQLAESWESSPDAKRWTFRIRKGVEFHNGKPLRPADVVASMNHHRGDDSQSSAKAYLKAVTDIRADGDNVVFVLDSGNADFPFILSDYHFRIMPANSNGSADWQSGVGTGAYRMNAFEPGVRFHGALNRNYWKRGRGHFDEVEIIGVKDTTARTNALTGGEADAINRCDTKTAHLLGRHPAVKILETTGTRHFTAPMHTDTAPFDNKDVRLALKYSADRKEMVEKVLFGHGLPGNDTPITPANTYFNRDMPQRDFDADKAKFHLKKAGMDSLSVKLSAADAAFVGAIDTAILWQQSAKRCGINIDVVREPDDGYWSNVWLKKPFSMCFWGGRPTEDLMFTVAYAEGAEWNDSRWKNKRFNELLLRARAELDTEKRREMYYEMQVLVSDDGGVPVLMYANYVDAQNKNVQYDKVASNWESDGLKSAERWWFAS